MIINLTPSMPLGIYFEKKKNIIEQGDIVAACLPSKLREEALQRGYVLKGLYCQGTTPLIKIVVACPGDRVSIFNNRIVVNGITHPIKKFLLDYQGRSLTLYPNGDYRSTGFWLIGKTSERSWDSRYFGELKPKQILCVLQPLLTW